MTNIKDKLSASVRMAKAAQQPAPKSAAKPAAKPAAAKPAPAPAKPVAAKPASPATHAGGIPESGTALFPERVWPD
ncbi:MAG: hypothetical protein AB1716_21810 [Planctomycetota bacterium]